MRAARPTPAFARVALALATISAGRHFGRIYLNRYPDPLGYGKSPSRFSDPPRRILEAVAPFGEDASARFLRVADEVDPLRIEGETTFERDARSLGEGRGSCAPGLP